MDTTTYNIDDLRRWAQSGPGDISPPPKVAVFGDPVAHSLSPEMHNPALKECGIDAQYVRLHITPEDLEEALRLLPAAGFYGTNVTIPHKTDVLRLVDSPDDLAKSLGAVNTVICEGDSLLGFNSDGPGFIQAVQHEFHVDVKDLRVLVLGAGGGAGRAVATQCAIVGCERLVLANRTFKKVEALKTDLESHFHDERVLGPSDRLVAIPWEVDALAAELDEVDLIVNGSSLGMKRTDPELIPARLIQPHHMIFDMVYSGAETKILNAAKSAGARGIDGLPMLLHQGVISFEWWFNRDAPIEAMRNGLMEAARNR